MFSFLKKVVWFPSDPEDDGPDFGSGLLLEGVADCFLLLEDGFFLLLESS